MPMVSTNVSKVCRWSLRTSTDCRTGGRRSAVTVAGTWPSLGGAMTNLLRSWSSRGRGTVGGGDRPVGLDQVAGDLQGRRPHLVEKLAQPGQPLGAGPVQAAGGHLPLGQEARV